MARTEVITDDLDGSQDAQPYEFSWDGTNWTIDLGEKNRKKLEDALRPYLDAARPARMAQAATSTPRRQQRASSGPSGIDYATIEHAGEPHRGRISPEEAKIVQEQFDEVNRRLSEKGMRLLDPADEKTKQRYGLK